VPRYDNPADDPEATPFLRRLADSAGDPLHRQVFADWLEEQGYGAAAQGQRWAARYNKAPGKPEHRPGGFTAPGGWYVGGIHPGHTGHLHGFMADDSAYAGRTLPMHFFMTEPGATWQTSRLFNTTNNEVRQNTHDPLAHESALLDATHRIKWDEHGEPLNPYSLDD
jgi:uncharacterized protein (TIGR02996 family)